MSNMGRASTVTFETWLNRSPDKARGFLSVFNDEPFDYESSTAGYELGRQLAVLAKLDGLRRSDLVRKRPKREDYAFVKTKLSRLSELAREAGFYNRLDDGGLFGKG